MGKKKRGVVHLVQEYMSTGDLKRQYVLGKKTKKCRGNSATMQKKGEPWGVWGGERGWWARSTGGKGWFAGEEETNCNVNDNEKNEKKKQKA